jgi:RNA polymerase sigma factor (sigma-70 family)
MPSSKEGLLCYIRRLAAPSAEEVSDAALLERFITDRDAQAFTGLVKRHGAMVLQVSWRILGNWAEAEDAFQATFLILARNAGAVQSREALPAWLHGVARRVALKARAARIRHRETRPLLEVPVDGRADPLAQISARELLTIVDEEVQRLPERYRLPVILCCLSGVSLEEAARQLGWTFGSVKGRLERGRARLHDRLVRRGLTLSAALTAVEISRATTSASLLAGLIARTIPGALAFGMGQEIATGVSTSATGLAGRVIFAMALRKFALTTALLLTAALGVGVAFTGKSPGPAPDQDSSPRADLVALRKPLQNAPAPFWDQSDVPIDVDGRVLDPLGNPVAGAELYVGYSQHRFVRQALPENPFTGQALPGPYPRRATTAADGRFHFRFATAELDPHMLDDARPAVMAISPGFGPAWAEIGPLAAGDLKLHLVDDLPVGGRVLDSNRRPMAGVKLVVQAVYSAPADELARFLKGDRTGWAPRCWKGPLPGTSPTILTDGAGRWRCEGLGRDRVAVFALEGPQVPRTFLNMASSAGEVESRFSLVHGPGFDYLAPGAHTIRGSVRDQTTREPIAGVTITIRPGNATSRTGPDGQFEIQGHSGQAGYSLVAQPEADQGLFANQICVRNQAGAAESPQDLFLVRGIALSGHVTNDSTGKPPSMATVEYYPLASNQDCAGISCVNLIPASTAKVRRDGSYSLAVLPGPGVIGIVASPREDYAVADVVNTEWSEILGRERALQPLDESLHLEATVPIALVPGQAGALPINKYHALALINPPKQAQSQVLDLALSAAQTLEGTVLGPDGQPLSGVEVAGLSALREEKEWLEGASFTITGLNRQGSRELFFRHRGKKLAMHITVPANAPRPVTVTLEPCGIVRGRLLDERGSPVPGVRVCFNEDAGLGYELTQTDELGQFQVAVFPGLEYSLAPTPRLLLKNSLRVQLGTGEIRDLGDLAARSQIPRSNSPQPTPGVAR